MGFLLWPRKLPKTFTGHGYQVTVNPDRTIVVKQGDWLSKYTLAIWGDCTEEHFRAFLVKRGASFVAIGNPKLLKVGDTLQVEPYTLPGEYRRHVRIRPPIGWGIPVYTR